MIEHSILDRWLGHALKRKRFMSGSSHPLNSFFGGSPLWVLVRLVLLSIVVGVIMAVLGLDVHSLILGIKRLLQHLFGLGFEAFDRAISYFLIGAVVVFPLWIISRLFARGR
jgi:hypothetical protein